MTDPKNGAGACLKNIMDALAENIAQRSDEEILKEAHDEGVDASAEAERTRNVLLSGVLRAKKQRLMAAQRAHESAVAAISSRPARLPADPQAKRSLLDRIIETMPRMKLAVVTVQHREFETFSDDDIDSALRQLDALGVLKDLKG